MSLAKRLEQKITEQEYLEGEKVSDIKYEYINGDVYAMAGANRKHNRIVSNFVREVDSQLKEKSSNCSTFSSDMKVKINTTSQCFYYPDVVVSCEENEENEYFTNFPKIIVEVLSKSTRKIDSTTKMIHYFTIPSLEEYVLIEQDFCEVQVFRKSEGWKCAFYFLGDEINFPSINVTLSVEDIYYQIKNDDMIDFMDQKLNHQLKE